MHHWHILCQLVQIKQMTWLLLSLLDNFDEDSEDVVVELFNISSNIMSSNIMDPKCAFNFGLLDVC